MKHVTNLPFIILLAGMLTSMLACNQSAKERSEQQFGERMISREDSLLIPPVDTILNKIANGDSLIIAPGGSIGALVLETMLSDSIMARLGRADSSDAATCKSWSMWYWDQGEKELDIYAACDPEVDMRKTIQIIRIKGFNYSTEQDDGIVDQHSTLEDIQATFPLGTMIPMGSAGEESRPDSLYEASDAGIAFEIDSKKRSTAVLVFPKGTTLENHFIPRGMNGK